RAGAPCSASAEPLRKQRAPMVRAVEIAYEQVTSGRKLPPLCHSEWITRYRENGLARSAAARLCTVCRSARHAAGITPDPAPALSAPSLGDRSGRQSESGQLFSKGYMRQRFDYTPVRLHLGQNAYSRSLLPACTSSPAQMLRESRCSRTSVLAIERILCAGEE